MVSHIIGNYLVNQGMISGEQLAGVLKEKRKIRANLGLIAVSEGILSYEEAQEIRAEGESDRAFAENAVEKGYLTEGQIKSMLRKQGNSYMAFAQALENLNVMNIEQLEQYLLEQQQKNGLSFTELEDLKSDDVNRILPIYFPGDTAPFLDAACVAVRTLIRMVDSGIYPFKAFLTNQWEVSNCVIQFVEGEKEFSYAIAGREKELAVVASCYMHEPYEKVDEEVLDVVGEIINCMSGLYASELSQDGIILDLLPPHFYGQIREISAESMLVLPLGVKNHTFYLLINRNNLVKIL